MTRRHKLIPFSCRVSLNAPPEQDYHDQQEAEHVRHENAEERGEDALGETEDEPAHHGAGNAPEPAEDHDHERLKSVWHSGGRSDRLDHRDEAAGDTRARGAQPECHRIGVTQVDADSPGAKAGIQIGDVITQVNGQKVTDSGELQVYVVQRKPGTKIDLTVLRNGKTETVPVTLQAMNPSGENNANATEGQGKMRWITVGPADQPGTSIVLHPPAADPASPTTSAAPSSR